MNRYFGYLKFKALCFGAVMALVRWYWFSPTPGNDVSPAAQQLVSAGWIGLALVMGFNLFAPLGAMFPWTRKRLIAADGLTVALALGVMLAMFSAAIHCSWNRPTLTYLMDALLVPVSLAWAPLWIVNAKARITAHPTFRRLFLTGSGSQIEFASHPHYSKLRMRRPLFWGWMPFGDVTPIGRTLIESTWSPYMVGIKKPESNSLTIATAGAGKLVRSILQKLLMLRHTCILLDPKGEIAALSAGARSGRLVGYPAWLVSRVKRFLTFGVVNIFNPYGIGPYRGQKLNPLFDIGDVNGPYARVFLNAISSALVIATNIKHRYWDELARLLIEGAIVHVLTTYDRSKQNFVFLAR